MTLGPHSYTAQLADTIETWLKENGYGPALSEEAWNAITKALRQCGPNVPEGWKLVPIEPTHEMVKTYKNAMRVYIVAAKAAGTFERWKKDGRGYVIPEREKCYARWTAMLGACPPFATGTPQEKA